MFYVASWLPFEEGTLAIWKTLPVLAGASFGVPHYLAFPQSQLATNAFGAGPARARRIQQPEPTFLQPQHGHIGLGADIEVAEFLVQDLLRRRPGGHANHVGERGAKAQ